MDMNSYILEKVVAARLAEVREQAQRGRLVESLRDDHRDWLAAIGLYLIKLGRWLAHRRVLRQRRTALPVLGAACHRSRA